MKVWFVNHYAHPPTDAGNTRHHVLARELSSRGHSAVVIAAGFDHFSQVARRAAGSTEVATIDGVRWCWLATPRYRGSGAKRVLNMVAFARRVRSPDLVADLEAPDVVVGSSPHPFAALAAAGVARRVGARFILEVRDVWPETLVALGGFSSRHPLIRVLARVERSLYRRAEHVVSLLPRGAEQLAAAGGDPARVTWIPNGVDVDALVPTEPTMSGETTFTYAGSHGLSNALDDVLDAAVLLDPEDRIRIRLVGAGPDKSRLQARATREGLEGVSFHDAVPHREIGELLKSSDAFLLTVKKASIYRWGMSITKLFDYMAAARPVVMSYQDADNPVTVSGGGVVVPPGDPRALAEAMRGIARLDRTARWEMGMRGRRYVEEHHDMRKLAQRFEEVLAPHGQSSR